MVKNGLEYTITTIYIWGYPIYRFRVIGKLKHEGGGTSKNDGYCLNGEIIYQILFRAGSTDHKMTVGSRLFSYKD